LRLMRIDSRIRDLDLEIVASEGGGEAERNRLLLDKRDLSRQRNALLVMASKTENSAV
jgi:hypothetical protein